MKQFPYRQEGWRQSATGGGRDRGEGMGQKTKHKTKNCKHPDKDPDRNTIPIAALFIGR